MRRPKIKDKSAPQASVARVKPTTAATAVKPMLSTSPMERRRPRRPTPKRSKVLAENSIPLAQDSCVERKLNAMPMSRAKSITGAP